jgi:hypothetical protein
MMVIRAQQAAWAKAGAPIVGAPAGGEAAEDAPTPRAGCATDASAALDPKTENYTSGVYDRLPSEFQKALRWAKQYIDDHPDAQVDAELTSWLPVIPAHESPVGPARTSGGSALDAAGTPPHSDRPLPDSSSAVGRSSGAARSRGL